jgi:peptidoglycan/xylan/chitin deacetylase (PgdA/CDA1 family)
MHTLNWEVVMKRFFEILGFLSLVCFSFFYTEKTIDVVKEVDDIMITLKEQAPKYQVKAENAKIDGKFMTPGISGKIVNLQKSYEEMKHYGKFHPNLLVYDKVSPEISIKNRYDKYIKTGNPKKRQVSFLFIVDEKGNPSPIIEILKDKKVTGTFFIDGSWLEKNQNELVSLIEGKFTVGNYSYRGDYGHESFVWIDTIIKRVGGQKQSYCLVEKENKKALSTCKLQKDYTIYPNIIIKENPYSELTEQVESGSIILMRLDAQVKKELPLMITYLKQKGYEIVNLEQLLEE